MRRILKIEVKNNKEFEAIKTALEDTEILSMLKVVGYLKPLSKNQQKSVLSCLQILRDRDDRLGEH